MWGPARPGATAREAEATALANLLSYRGDRVRTVLSRWDHQAPVTTTRDEKAHARLLASVSSSPTYKEMKGSVHRFACDGSYDPESRRGAWGWAKAGTDAAVTGLLDAPSSTYLEIYAACEALRTTPISATVELLIDYKPLVDAISGMANGTNTLQWPVLRRCNMTRELVEDLEELVSVRRVCATWTPGHRGHRLFSRVDQATRAAVRAERRNSAVLAVV